MRATIVFRHIKDPDGFGELATALGLSEEQIDRHFKWGEYASIEIEVDANLNITGGRILPLDA